VALPNADAGVGSTHVGNHISTTYRFNATYLHIHVNGVKMQRSLVPQSCFGSPLPGKVESVMTASGWIAVYSLAVLVVSMVGGLLPLANRITHNRLQLYLSASAGVMLGAAFFHIIPDAVEFSGANFGWWMSLGVVGLFCIERFIAPHTHEVGEGHLA